MCGIAGIYNLTRNEPLPEKLLEKMGEVIAHRGPDERGIYINEDKSLGFAHRRLSIIDLALGKQPMSNNDGTIWIVFNGEIYNFRELRKELTIAGYVFKTNSDTEVIINLYHRYGEKCFERLNGIFAFAIYDAINKCLVLARDHFGVKPLYYALVNGRLIFGSEIKVILQNPEYKKAMNLTALNSFLTFRYNPSPQTLFTEIKKLAPAHYLKVDGRGKMETESFWSYTPRENHAITEKEAIKEYQYLLEQAVKRQLVSDVPVGLLLSGGVDSAIIGYLMQNSSPEQIKTFSIGFNEKGDYNELFEARQTANYIKSKHYDLTISQKEYLEIFLKSFYYLEEPIASPTIPALYYVAQLASQHVKVVLSGQGADEPLAGYKRYFGEKYISKNIWILKLLSHHAIKNIIPRNEGIKRAIYAAQFKNELDRFLAIYTIFTPAQKEKLIRDEYKNEMKNDDLKIVENIYKNTGNLDDSLSKMLYIDTRSSLSDNLLLLGDKITMAHSLECRVPFLDIELVQFIESLPSNFKLRGWTHKYIHKMALKKWLPHYIISRKKRGFVAPLDVWFQTDLSDRFIDIIKERDSACNEYFNINYINDMFKLHKKRKEDYHRHIFALLSFEMWFRYFYKK